MTAALIIGFGLIGRGVGTKLSTTHLFDRVIVVDKEELSDICQKIFSDSDTTAEFHCLKVTEKNFISIYKFDCCKWSEYCC